ncbi:MAG TPA: chlorite dismutase family protein [Nitrososphaeraceae archaeon]|nr:chlorite dismutase family protein [Nitrososphaeraceae archaeon]
MSFDKVRNSHKENNEKTSDNTATTMYLNFSFYKVDSKWRWLNDIGKEEAAKELSSLIEVANTKMKVRTYSTLGLRKESDFMIWGISDSLEKIQVLTSKVYGTVLGKYIEASEVYLSASRPSVYSNQVTPSFMKNDEPLKYNIVYPFIKSREWYLLPFEKRNDMMKEHINVGKMFPQIRLNTSYSFGISDQDFMLAFETDNLMDFQDLIIKLRETQVSRHVLKDTPMIVCVYKNIFDIIKSLG